jgi:hypothetical protein
MSLTWKQVTRVVKTRALAAWIGPGRADASVGGSFAAAWARMVLKKCSSERGEREKRFYVGRRSERRRTAFWRAAQNTLGASGGAKPTRACVPRTVNGTGH